MVEKIELQKLTNIFKTQQLLSTTLIARSSGEVKMSIDISGKSKSNNKN